ncbi:MAG: hypothetical protein GY757_05025, partial [bacterium]|nr:hypothetical protein [bacterium]
MKEKKLDMKEKKEKIVLALLPFWTPLLPPQGLSRLKGYLQPQGYRVKTVDANLEKQFKELYDLYFETLRQGIPREKQGNFYNIGNDVWREHMMAHINYEDEEKYIRLVEILIDKIFYCPVETTLIRDLNGILTRFYSAMEHYVVQLLEREKPEYFGVSVYRDTLPATLFALRLTRKKFPQIKTLIGGGIFTIQLTLGSPNFDEFMRETEEYIDKVIVGEGEKILLKYLEGKIPQQQRLLTKADVDGEVSGFAPREMFDFSDFDTRYYHYTAAQASAGCPNRCSFCNVYDFYGGYRSKDTVKTVNEMLDSYRENKTQLFFMLDSLVNDVAAPLAGELLKKDTSLYWDGYFRVEEACSREKAL